MTIREYVASLDLTTVWAICDSYEQFERDGFIGDEPCRTRAQEFVESIGARPTPITMWMQMLTFECYRRVAVANR